MDDLHQSLDMRSAPLLVLLDFSVAFDTINYAVLQYWLAKL